MGEIILSNKNMMIQFKKDVIVLKEILGADVFGALLFLRYFSSPLDFVQLSFDNIDYVDKDTPWNFVVRSSREDLPLLFSNFPTFFKEHINFEQYFPWQQIQEIKEKDWKDGISFFSHFSFSFSHFSQWFSILEQIFFSRVRLNDSFLKGFQNIDLNGKVISDLCVQSGQILSQIINNKKSNVYLASSPTLIGYVLSEIRFRTMQQNVIWKNLEQNYDSLTDKADFIVLNPPFNQKTEHPFERKIRWKYGISSKNVNFLWIQHALAHLKENGTAVMILPNSTLTTMIDNDYQIRRNMILDHQVEAIITFPAHLFLGTSIPFCLWIFHEDVNREEILIIDGMKASTKIHNYLDAIASWIWQYRNHTLASQNELFTVASFMDIARHDFVLSPNLYMNHAKIKLDFSRKQLFKELLKEVNRKYPSFGKSIHWDELLEQVYHCKWNTHFLMDYYVSSGGILKEKYFFGSGTPLLDVKDVVHSDFLGSDFSKKVQTTREEERKYNILKGDLFFNRTSENVRELAMCSIALYDQEGVYSSYIKRFRPIESNSFDLYYLSGFFRSAVYRDEIEKIVTVYTTRVSMDQKKFSKVVLYVPEKEIELKIAEVICTLNHYDLNAHTLLKQFQDLFIEQFITYPIWNDRR